jgi:hypothetical protein
MVDVGQWRRSCSEMTNGTFRSNERPGLQSSCEGDLWPCAAKARDGSLELGAWI